MKINKLKYFYINLIIFYYIVFFIVSWCKICYINLKYYLTWAKLYSM